MMKKYLSDLLEKSHLSVYQNAFHKKNKDIEVGSISLDSREVTERSLFIATSSKRIKENIEDALKSGCYIFVVQKEYNFLFEKENNVIVLNASNCYEISSKLASVFYPEQPKTVVYVTGTNGKSSTVSLLRQIWVKNDLAAASFGTLGLESNLNDDGELNIPPLTSPDPISFHKLLNYLNGEKITHLVCEASSHGLDQFRLDHTNVSAGGFLNLTQDHLDYHKTMDAYFEAKSTLFSRVLPQGAFAVLNKDTTYFQKLYEICRDKNLNVITFSQKQSADFCLLNQRHASGYSLLDVNFKDHVFKDLRFNLFGQFQVENLLCASALAYASGIDLNGIVTAYDSLKCVSGRMEYIATRNGADIFVDFAHTPDALLNVLNNVNAYKSGKIHLVFGCGGDRDKKKRPLMGDIAKKNADVVYVTDDNPRFENPANIRSEIFEAVPNAMNIDGRSRAIHIAIDNLQPGDILVIAGKGHEEGQIIGDVKYPFSDKEEVLNYLKRAS